MSNYKLSILIPSRNEEFLARTVQDLLENKTEDTEILVGLDGALASPAIPDHQDVRILYYPKSIGQRKMQNQLCKISKAKYVMKLDAHVAVDKHFDKKMIDAFEVSGDNTTMVMTMRNLHVFDWVCEHCGMRVYQGPKPEACRNETCTFDKQSFKREIVWIPKTNPQSSAYRFNKNLQFKYFPELRKTQKKEGLVETMSLQGSCFMCTRENYWKYELCDESWGSWGQQGSEVAIKTHLSGGKVLCNRDTWYAHLFRTQPGFNHPFSLGNSQHNARKICRDIFLNNKWSKQVHPLSWLLEKFWPELQEVKDPETWTEKDLKELKDREKSHPEFGTRAKEEKSMIEKSKSIIYYTDNQLKLSIAHTVQDQLRSIGLPIVSSSLKPMPHFGYNVYHPRYKRGVLTMFKQILAALEASDAEVIFHCEADCLYPKEHFDFTPPKKDTFYYNLNVIKIDANDGKTLKVDVCRQVSGLCAYRELLVDEYRRRVETVERDGFNRNSGYEPGTKCLKSGGYSDIGREDWNSKVPVLDIRHGNNLTKNRFKKEQFRNQSNTAGWTEGNYKDIKSWDIGIIEKVLK